MSNPAATLNDFNRLSDPVRKKHADLLKHLQQANLTCRVEAVGREIHIVVGPAMPVAAYWLDRYQID